MAQTKFSGPVNSTAGFAGNISATVLTSSSATITNLLCTSLTIGSAVISVVAKSGTVSSQMGYIKVMVGATTAYLALYASLTP